MFDFYYHQVPQEHRGWKSSSEIEMAALKHEKMRRRLLDQNMLWAPAGLDRKAGFLASLKATMQVLLAVIW